MSVLRIEDTICFKHDRIAEIIEELKCSTVDDYTLSLLEEAYILTQESKNDGVRMESRLKVRKNHVRYLVDQLWKNDIPFDLSIVKKYDI